MPQDTKPANGSPFEIVTPGKSKKLGKTGIIVGALIVVFLILSVIAGVLLVRQQQNVQEKAAAVDNTCPGAEACPWGGGSGYAAGYLLRSCHPGLSNGTVVKESLCNQAGRVATCGPQLTQYCCPSVNGAWTTDMTACNSISGTPTPTPTATPDLKNDSTNCGSVGNVCPGGTTCISGTCTSSGGTPTPTGAQNSCNGTCGSNSNCQSGLYCYSGYCRNPLCASDTSCGCSSSATDTPTPASTSTPAPTPVSRVQTTPLPIPVTGTDWATYLGIGVGASAVIVSLLLAI